MPSRMSAIERTTTACRTLLQSASDNAGSVAHDGALAQFLEASGEVLAATECLVPRAACHLVIKVRANLLQTSELLSVVCADLHNATDLELIKAQEGLDQILAAARELRAGVEQSRQ